MNTPWYRRPWLTILLLVLVPWAGLVTTWLFQRWSRTVKSGVTAIGILWALMWTLAVVALGSPTSPRQQVAAPAITATAASVQPTPAPTTVPTAAPTVAPTVASATATPVPPASVASVTPPTSLSGQPASAPPITFDRTDFKGGFAAESFQIAVNLTNHDNKPHQVAVDAYFYSVPLRRLGDDPAIYIVTAGAVAKPLALAPGQATAVLINARNVLKKTILSVSFRAICHDGIVSDNCGEGAPSQPT